MDFKIKVNVDTGEAIEKLEHIKSFLDMVKTSISEENAKNNDFTLF